MKHLLAFVAALGLLVTPFTVAQAQVVQAVTVASCGTPPNMPIIGGTYPVLMDQTGKLCTSGTGGGGGGAVTAASGAYVSGSIADLGPYTTANTVAYFLSQIAAGTAASSTLPIYGQATSQATAPSYTTATPNPFSLDLNGGLRTQQANQTPAAATASTITTGGTAVTAVTGPVRGCYITNPTSATDENIGTAENLYVNPVTTATTTGNGTTLTLVPGQSFFCIPGQTTSVSAVAATSSHKFTAVVW